MTQRSSKFNVQSSNISELRTTRLSDSTELAEVSPKSPNSTLRTPDGFTYLALLAAIVIIGITLGAAGKSWQAMSQRDKEAELLFRGDQYRQAIESYYLYQGRRQYPANIEDLLKDSRSPTGKRHLRQRFMDPFTGKDFVEVRDQLSRRIVAVHSASEKEPLRQKNFPEPYRDFEGKTKYSEWIFSFADPHKMPVQVR